MPIPTTTRRRQDASSASVVDLRHRSDMPSARASLLATLPLIALLGCASSGPKTTAPTAVGADVAAPTVAGADTWMTLAAQGARMKVPAGWSIEKSGDALLAKPKDGSAAIVFAGATTKREIETALRSIGDRFRVDGVDYAKGRPARVHGIPVVVYEDMAATTTRTPADVLVMVGDAPNGKGVVMVFVMAFDESQAHDLAIIDAANSLSPLASP